MNPPDAITADAVQPRGPEEAALAAFVGGARAGRYLRVFRRFGPDGRFRATWNWAAFCFGFFWLLYRRMYLFAAAYFFGILFLMVLLLLVAEAGADLAPWVLAAVNFAALPPAANWLYYRHALDKIARARAKHEGEEAVFAALRQRASTSGFMAGTAFVALFLLVVILPATYTDAAVRMAVSEGIAAVSAYRSEIVEYHIRNGKFPAPGDLPPPPHSARALKSVALGDKGVMTLTFQGYRHIEGRRVTLVPDAAGAGVNWTCRNVDMPVKELPLSCRERQSR